MKAELRAPSCGANVKLLFRARRISMPPNFAAELPPRAFFATFQHVFRFTDEYCRFLNCFISEKKYSSLNCEFTDCGQVKDYALVLNVNIVTNRHYIRIFQMQTACIKIKILQYNIIMIAIRKHDPHFFVSL